jgi:hypothetical protein
VTDQLGPEFVAQLLATVRVVETNSQLLLNELRATRKVADQTAATLSLVVGLMANARELDRGYIAHRLARDLLTCAEVPDMATGITGCDPQAIDPSMLRAAAALLCGGDSLAPPTSLEPHAMH